MASPLSLSPSSSSSSFSSSSSSSSSSTVASSSAETTTSEPFVFESYALSWVCAEMKKNVSIQLQIRRLSYEGSIYAQQLEFGRPAWLFDTPLAPLRHAIVGLLYAEKTLLKFKDHGKQFAKNYFVQQVEEIVNTFATDVFTGTYFGDSIEHPLVANIRNKAKWLTTELSKLPVMVGTIAPLPTLLTQNYVRPVVTEEEDNDDVVFVEVRRPKASKTSPLVSLV
jgi:hypothetical protein